MVQLSSMEALFELGLTFNAAVPLLVEAARRTRAGALEPIVAEVQLLDPKMMITPQRAAYLKKAALQFYPGLRTAYRITRALIGVSLTAAAISFLGLMQSILVPDAELSPALVWAYGLTAVAGLPIVYYLTYQFLEWLRETLAGRMATTPELRRASAELFLTLIQANDQLRAHDAAFAQMTEHLDTLKRDSNRTMKEADKAIAEMDRLIAKSGLGGPAKKP